jgi:hypothetical protein
MVYNAATFVMLFVPVASAATAFNAAYVIGCAVSTCALAVFYREHSKRYDYDTTGAHPDNEIEAGAYCESK